MGSQPVAAARCLALAALLATAAAVASTATDTPPLILEPLTASDGLPQSTVNTTLQDSQGFIWLGTEDGLVRYDGDRLVRYTYARGAHGSLPGNYIHQIVEDAHHDLWIAIKDAGVARWNRATDDFTLFRHEPGNPNSLASDAAHAVLVDARGRVWIGMTDAGVDILDPATGRFQRLRHDPANPGSLIDDRVFTLAQDRSGDLWVGTEAGLDRWDGERQAFVHYRHVAGDARSLGGNDISSVLEDDAGQIWIGTHDGGLTRMDRAGDVLHIYRHEPRRPGSLSSDDVRALLEDRFGHIWVGTAGGLDLFERSSDSFAHYRHDPSDAGSLPDSFIMSLYEDHAGLVWIGTYTGGVSRWNPSSWELGGHRPGWLDGKLVTAFAAAPQGQVWIASAGAGLVRFDPDSGRATELATLIRGHNVLPDRRVMALRTDRHGTLWIGTMASGLQALSADGHLRAIPVRRGDPRATSAAGIMTIFQAHDGRLWIGTYEGGLNVLDPASGLIRQLPDDPSLPGAISARSVRAIAEDQDGDFWIGTNGGGLDLADAAGHVLGVYRHDPHDPTSLPADTVYALAVDAHDRLWIGTDGGGLAELSGSARAPASIRFRTLSPDEGLSSDTIDGVLTDAAGRLWLSGNAGLMRLDPDSGTIKTFHREDGLQGEEFDSGAFYRLPDGRLCFGGPGGFNIFDPAHLTESRQPPRLALTQVEVLGVPLATRTPTWLLKRIALDYRANILSLDFGVLDFAAPKRNRIAYRMAGLTDRWIDLGAQHRINLTNLDAGDHVLEVQAANSDSVWSPPLRLIIHRDAAPWKSRSAYSAYAIAALALLAYAISRQRARFRRIVRDRQRLESEVQLRTRELVESNRQLAEAAQVKSRFLDRMSHELRTPMNGVVGMTELLGHTALSPAQARLTQTIRSSAQILLQTVNDLLDLSKISAGKVQLEELPVDLLQLLEACADLFVGQGNGVEVITCPPPRDWHNLLGDPLRLRQILINLTANAVKFTEQGEVVLKADIQPLDGGRVNALFTISDTGIGMDAATIERIFEPFTQADESTTRRFGGTGLGLAICRELTELMGGSIRVESRPGLGSTFYVTVPLKLGAERQPAPSAPSPPRSARILTRRAALAESLAHHLAALGVTVIDGPADADASVCAGAQIIIADADTLAAHPDLQAHARGQDGARPALLLVASTAELERLASQPRDGVQAVLPRPLRREALQVALAGTSDSAFSAVGLSGPPAGPAALAAQAVRGHVLLVEDDPVNAAVAQGYLAALGCSSVWVTAGAQAVARTAVERFDLILMDLSMPGMDGLATTALIRQRDRAQRRTPIIALTAHDLSRREPCLAAGMDDILSKPCTLEQCAQVLGRWLSDRSADGRADGRADGQAAPPDAGAARSAIDATAVARLRRLGPAGPSDLYTRVAELFCSSSLESMQRLRTALEQADLAGAAAVCHKLGSSAANVGAAAFAADVRRLERSCRAGELAPARALHRQLAADYPALIDELRELRIKESA